MGIQPKKKTWDEIGYNKTSKLKPFTKNQIFGEGKSLHNIANKIVNTAKTNVNSPSLPPLEKILHEVKKIMETDPSSANNELQNALIRLAKSDPNKLFANRINCFGLLYTNILVHHGKSQNTFQK